MGPAPHDQSGKNAGNSLRILLAQRAVHPFFLRCLSHLSLADLKFPPIRSDARELLGAHPTSIVISKALKQGLASHKCDLVQALYRGDKTLDWCDRGKLQWELPVLEYTGDFKPPRSVGGWEVRNWPREVRDLLVRHAGRAVHGPVTYFVSHTHSACFGELVKLIMRHYASLAGTQGGLMYKPVFYWLDVAAVNHTYAGEIKDNSDIDIAAVIKASSGLLCAAHEWQAPVIFGRVWCLFEILHALAQKIRIEVRFMHEGGLGGLWRYNGLEDRLRSLELLLADVDIHKATAMLESDRKYICQWVLDQPGLILELLNRKLPDLLRGPILESLSHFATGALLRFDCPAATSLMLTKRAIKSRASSAKAVTTSVNLGHINSPRGNIADASNGGGLGSTTPRHDFGAVRMSVDSGLKALQEFGTGVTSPLLHAPPGLGLRTSAVDAESAASKADAAAAAAGAAQPGSGSSITPRDGVAPNGLVMEAWGPAAGKLAGSLLLPVSKEGVRKVMDEIRRLRIRDRVSQLYGISDDRWDEFEAHLLQQDKRVIDDILQWQAPGGFAGYGHLRGLVETFFQVDGKPPTVPPPRIYDYFSKVIVRRGRGTGHGGIQSSRAVRSASSGFRSCKQSMSGTAGASTVASRAAAAVAGVAAVAAAAAPASRQTAGTGGKQRRPMTASCLSQSS